MKKLLSLALISAAIAGISVAVMSLIKKRQNNEDDIIYSEDFDDYDEDEDEDGSYFDVHMAEDEGVNLQEDDTDEQ